jgi:integrase
VAFVEDRWFKTVVGTDKKRKREKTELHGKGMRYRVRYLTPDGHERSKSFPDKMKSAADDFLVSVEHSKLKGTYVDPDAGRVTLRQYVADFLSAATSDESTRDRLERQFRLHILPTLGDLALATIQPATIRSWNRHIQEKKLADSYCRNLFNDLSTVLNCAVDDKLIISNPCSAKTVRAVKYVPTKVVPWTTERLRAFRAEVPDRYRLTVDLGSGCGQRQGEIFAVSPDDLDSSRPVLHVVRQIKLVRGKPIFALPKGGKVREVPLPDSVAQRLADHAALYPPVPVTLPWGSSTGEPRTFKLFLSTPEGEPVTRNEYNLKVWKPAIRRSGIPDDRHNGMHVLRHTYASVLLDAGESIKALSLYLGHADPGFTLRVYTHLLPSSENRTRRAIDHALGDLPETLDGL